MFSLRKYKINFERKNCNYFLILQFKHLFWVLKRTSHQEGSFEYPQYMLWLRNKEINVFYVLLSEGLELYTGDALAKHFDYRRNNSSHYGFCKEIVLFSCQVCGIDALTKWLY